MVFTENNIITIKISNIAIFIPIDIYNNISFIANYLPIINNDYLKDKITKFKKSK